LVRRYDQILRRWAHGRLPVSARDLVDTDDLVQITLLQALNRLGEFEPRREGAFLAYLRQILLNRVRDEIRVARRRPGRAVLSEEMNAGRPSPLEEAIGREAMAAYESALAHLPDEQREAIVMRIELGFTHNQVAEALDCPSPDAARMLVARGLVRLAELMDEPG
jgi:RNA polymerase sigma-70 factor (ECF subfamily)